jgi:hypothetical protein
LVLVGRVVRGSSIFGSAGELRVNMNAPDEICLALAAGTPPQDFYHLVFSGPANSLIGAFRLRYLAPLCQSFVEPTVS